MTRSSHSPHEAVAQVIWTAVLAPRAEAVLATEKAAALAIGIALAEAQHAIETLEQTGTGGRNTIYRHEAVAALAALAGDNMEAAE